MMFKSTTGTTQDRDEDRLLHEKKTSPNWDNMKGSGVSADRMAQMRDSHREVDKEEVKGAMMPMPELKNDVIDRSQTRRKLQPKLRILDNDRLSMEDETGIGDVVMEWLQWKRK